MPKLINLIVELELNKPEEQNAAKTVLNAIANGVTDFDTSNSVILADALQDFANNPDKVERINKELKGELRTLGLMPSLCHSNHVYTTIMNQDQSFEQVNNFYESIKDRLHSKWFGGPSEDINISINEKIMHFLQHEIQQPPSMLSQIPYTDDFVTILCKIEELQELKHIEKDIRKTHNFMLVNVVGYGVASLCNYLQIKLREAAKKELHEEIKISAPKAKILM